MWTLDSGGAPPLWRLAGDVPAAVGFTTRRGGVSRAPYDSLNVGRSTGDRPENVTENRRRVLAALGLDLERLATAGQVHGARIVEVSEPGHVPECDALLSRTPGLAVAVTTADCLPIVLLAPGVVAVAHSGWRGTAAGMPRVALGAVCAAAGVAPADVAVHVGPCIRACCYAVGPDVLSEFPAAATRPAAGRTHLDLVEATRLQLTAAGLPASSWNDTGACTACAPDWYFSHRRDGSPSGRQWAVAALRPGTLDRRDARGGRAV
uniref:Laccase domain-containing protein n=1 Tax=Eiseniibacteriota bacterium TaxID=2212470 RepID=A0A832I932_UNCEI